MPALPESIRKQAELSNQLQAKFKAGTLTTADFAPTAPIEQPAMPSGFVPQAAGPGVPGLNTSGFNPQPAAEPQRPQTTTANAAAAPPAPPAAQITPASAGEEATSEHRFKVLQGKYNAEVPRLHKEKTAAEQRAAALEQQLAATQALLANLNAPASAPQAPQPSLVSPKEVQEFGPDLYDFVKRAASEVMQPQIRTLEQEFRPFAQHVQQMAPVVQQTQQESQQTAQALAEEKFYNGLDSSVANWEQINSAPEFHAWLAEQDPYAGQVRGAMLHAAYRNYDLPRAVAFFTGFMKEHAAVAPQGSPAASAPAGTPQPGTPTVDLRSLAAPGTGVGGPANAGAPNESGQARSFTTAEISAFYRDVQKGLYKGRPADKDATERAIFFAQKAGLVRP